MKLHTQMVGQSLQLFSERGLVATMEAGYQQTREEDAAYIEKCVNNYECMHGMIQKLVEKLERWPGDENPEFIPIMKQARAFLDATKGGI